MVGFKVTFQFLKVLDYFWFENHQASMHILEP